MKPFSKNPASHSVALHAQGVSIELVRKRIQHMYARVLPPDGRIRVSAPIAMSDERIRDFVLSKLTWLLDRQERVRGAHQRQTRSFSQGEEVPVWGKGRKIRVFTVGSRRRCFLCGEFVDLYVRASDTLELRMQLFEKLLRAELGREIRHLLLLWCPRVGVPHPTFAIRRMRTRWGSCSPGTGHLRFALQLAEKPAHFLEYVVVHELTHLLERSHNQQFKAYLDALYPHWKTVRSEMRAPYKAGSSG